MTDWRAAGQLADAHRVATLARAAFDSPDKSYARTGAIAFIANHYGSGRILDLWGGGASADQMVALGLPVISVEDGRWLRSGLDISATRSQRSLYISGREGGYETSWGPAAKIAGGCSAAFYDLCGHWCKEVRRLLIASQHMTAIAITLMPERVSVGHGLTLSEWRAVYATLLQGALPRHTVKRTQHYRRDGGQNVFVFHLLLHIGTVSPRQPKRLTEAGRLARNREMRERYIADPEYRARSLARAAEHKRRRKEILRSTPEGAAFLKAMNAAAYRRQRANETPIRRAQRRAQRALQAKQERTRYALARSHSLSD